MTQLLEQCECIVNVESKEKPLLLAYSFFLNGNLVISLSLKMKQMEERGPLLIHE